MGYQQKQLSLSSHLHLVMTKLIFLSDVIFSVYKMLKSLDLN